MDPTRLKIGDLAAGLPARTIRDLLPCVRQDGTVTLCKLDTLEQHLQGLDDRITALQETHSSLSVLVTAARAEEAPIPARP
ncbi:hypothetical protein OG338_07600 [Streptomyces sp. NBC_00726]|uniref:hypothetical protein n=1 Tax=Streptomyces sp. NBC_00726 TaxID=2903674 RepID=UPI00386390C5